jgi:hypothetical protein
VRTDAARLFSPVYLIGCSRPIKIYIGLMVVELVCSAKESAPVTCTASLIISSCGNTNADKGTQSDHVIRDDRRSQFNLVRGLNFLWREYGIPYNTSSSSRMTTYELLHNVLVINSCFASVFRIHVGIAATFRKNVREVYHCHPSLWLDRDGTLFLLGHT